MTALLLPVTDLYVTTISGGPVLEAYTPNPGTGTLYLNVNVHTPDPNPGCPHTTIKIYLNGSSYPDQIFTPTLTTWCVSLGTPSLRTFSLATIGSYPYYQIWQSECGGCGWNGLIDISSSPPTACAYGTETNPDAQVYTTITSALIDVVVAGVLAGTAQAEWIPFVETALGALEGSVLFGIDCTTLPSGGTTLNLTDLSTITRENLLAWFQHAAWSYFCRCTAAPAGDPAPVPPPEPGIIPPTGVSSTPPPIVCDDTDLCTILGSIKSQLGVLTAQLGYLRKDVTLIQRQGVPFGYIPGPLFGGLSGTGTLDVSDILAFSVQCTTVPPNVPRRPTTPTIYYGMGRVAWGTADGWEQGHEVSHNPALYLDVAGDVTRIGYWFFEGVVANIQTYVREP